jgi:hypothetical protein
MSYEAVIAFAPETSAKRLNDPRRGKRTLYDTSQLRMLPHEQTIPLLVDHDENRELGRVNELMRLRDSDGWWLCAIATLEKCPVWLKRGVPSSFRFNRLQSDGFGNDIVRAGLVREVSVLSSAEPYEPLARVWSVKAVEEAKPKAAPAVVRRSEPSARGRREIDELHRRLDWLGPKADFEAVLENLRRDLGYAIGMRSPGSPGGRFSVR